MGPPQPSTIRVRAQANGTTTEVQTLIQHPMDSGFVKDANGVLIPPHHIEIVVFEHDGKTVLKADWGPAVSKGRYGSAKPKTTIRGSYHL